MKPREPDFTYSMNALVMTVPAPPARCRVGITRVIGNCPFGFMEEDTWEIDEKGRLNYPLCPLAVEALRPVLQKLSEGQDLDTTAECGLEDCRLTFLVHSREMLTSGRDH